MSTATMAEVCDFCPDELSVAVGSRRSRAAVFGNEATDRVYGSASQERVQSAPDEQGVSTSSRTTAV